jgi:hypothetical protein
MNDVLRVMYGSIVDVINSRGTFRLFGQLLQREQKEILAPRFSVSLPVLSLV